jgi:xanthine dehydrogenase accessory factor
MRAEILRLAADLAERGEPFALAIVVRREPASSTQPGDMALITEAGAFHGWLGGTCTQPTVVREARQALADGRPRLIALSPDPSSDHRAGVAVHAMTCHSGGTVDIYLEPVLPRPRVVVFGAAPSARALCRIGKAMGYAVDVVDPDADATTFPEADRVYAELPALPRPAPLAAAARRETYAVVATMGQRDEDALLAAIALEPTYLGLIASRKRFAEMSELLAARGAPAAALRRVRNPAGLDLGAKTPEEIALSILAEIVKLRRSAEAMRPSPSQGEEQTFLSPSPSQGEGRGEGGTSSVAVDPICGMEVVVATARFRAEHAGRAWYFCNARCREKFLATPERYAAERAEASR